VRFEPMQGVAKVELVQMHDEVNGPAAAGAALPIEKLGAAHGQHTPRRVPFARVVWIASGGGLGQEVFQGDGAHTVGALAPVGR
jgi:hypothetical protein